MDFQLDLSTTEHDHDQLTTKLLAESSVDQGVQILVGAMV